LFRAAQNGHTSIVELLLQRGVNIQGANNNGLTVLHAAALNRHLPIVQLLIDNEVDVLVVDKDSDTALFKAA
jgi:ankyrin repeat protein